MDKEEAIKIRVNELAAYIRQNHDPSNSCGQKIMMLICRIALRQRLSSEYPHIATDNNAKFLIEILKSRAIILVNSEGRFRLKLAGRNNRNGAC